MAQQDISTTLIGFPVPRLESAFPQELLVLFREKWNGVYMPGSRWW